MLKIVHMPEVRYPQACYKILFNTRLLYHFGFSFAWINQGVGDVTTFFITVKHILRLKDNYLQSWQSDLHYSANSNLYSEKSNL